MMENVVQLASTVSISLAMKAMSGTVKRSELISMTLTLINAIHTKVTI